MDEKIIEEIAEVFRAHANYIATAPVDSRAAYHVQWKNLVKGVGSIIQKHNPNYSISNYYTQCGWGLLKLALK